MEVNSLRLGVGVSEKWQALAVVRTGQPEKSLISQETR